MDSLCYTGKYDEGVEAFRNGKTIEDNPYPCDSYNHGAWSQGWFDTMVAGGVNLGKDKDEESEE